MADCGFGFLPGEGAGALDVIEMRKSDGGCEEFWYLVDVMLAYTMQLPGRGIRLEIHELGMPAQKT